MPIALALQLLLLGGFNEEIRYRLAGTPSFEQFYSEHLFTKIKQYIGKMYQEVKRRPRFAVEKTVQLPLPSEKEKTPAHL